MKSRNIKLHRLCCTHDLSCCMLFLLYHVRMKCSLSRETWECMAALSVHSNCENLQLGNTAPLYYTELVIWNKASTVGAHNKKSHIHRKRTLGQLRPLRLHRKVYHFRSIDSASE